MAMVFPGQGSQSQGMQADLAEKFQEIEDTYAEASEVLGYDLWRLTQDGPPERLGETVVTQPAMLTAGVAAWRAWQAAGGAPPDFMAGHSLGEYTALVCAGALNFDDALLLVRRRSQLMQDAVPVGEGAMAAIIGLDDDAVRRICDEASGIGVAEPVNFNSPGQVVIAGHKPSILRAVERAEAAGARRAVVLKVSVPSHSSLMIKAGEALADSLQSVPIDAPSVPVINATDARPYTDVEDIRAHLARQVYSAVHWVDTVRYMLAEGASAIVECGPGRVLSGLVRRIANGTPVYSIDSVERMQAALAG
jgi:[acyl-carrier-protein] S-malonyltransferase